jgi:hypothetical protein
MNKPVIKTYKDLLDEKERLQSLLKVQKQVLRDDFRGIKAELEPIRNVASFAGKFLTREKDMWVLNTGANTVIDLLFKKLILSRAGWLTKTIVPFLVKNYSSHVLSENKVPILKKIFSLFKKNKGRDKAQSNGTSDHVAQHN